MKIKIEIIIDIEILEPTEGLQKKVIFSVFQLVTKFYKIQLYLSFVVSIGLLFEFDFQIFIFD
jgi:hypothetical protein